MAKVNVAQVVEASAEEVWKSWDDFGNIDKFHPALAGSHLLGEHATGVGATRQCDMKDGNNHIRERIVEYVPKARMVIDIYAGTMPLKHAVATLTLQPAGPNKTVVSMEMDFVPKFGLLGKLMTPIMKPQFRGLLKSLLEANATHVQGMAA